MPRVTGVDKDQGHDNTINNTSGIIPSFTDDKNGSDLDTIIEEVKQEFRNLLIKRKDLITRLGNAFESVYASTPESVCEEIKNCLREEIADRIISARDIERYCPDKWKKKTKPKNDNLSFSKQVEDKPQQQIAVTQEGKSGTLNKTSSNTHSINQLLDQNGISVNNETQTTATDQCKSVSCNEPKASTESSSIDNADTVQKLVSDPSDKQIGGLEAQTLKRTSVQAASEFEFTIPKEKYRMMRDAMDKSKASIFVKFDENKIFVRADPDMVFDISGANHRDRNVQQIQFEDVARDEEHFKRHSKGNRRAVSDVRSEG